MSEWVAKSQSYFRRFDTAIPGKLLQKYGLKDAGLMFIKRYLTDRAQIEKRGIIANCACNWKNPSHNIPLGVHFIDLFLDENTQRIAKEMRAKIQFLITFRNVNVHSKFPVALNVEPC